MPNADLPPPKALFLDLDETLLADNASFTRSIQLVCEDLQGELPDSSLEGLETLYRAHSEAYWLDVGADVMAGRMSGTAVRLETWRRALAECGLSDEGIAQFAAKAYAKHRSETVTLYDDAKLLLERIAGRFTMAIITNGSSRSQRQKVEEVALDLAAHIVVVSGEVGIAKPDPGIFRYALNRLRLRPADCWHIGDNLVADVAGARATGMTAVWLNRPGNARPESAAVPDLEIRTLEDLLPLLELARA
jgi:putative hydrolase of the HAD superfamily